MLDLKVKNQLHSQITIPLKGIAVGHAADCAHLLHLWDRRHADDGQNSYSGIMKVNFHTHVRISTETFAPLSFSFS